MENGEFVQGEIYVVNYEENTFLGLPESTQEHCFDTWCKKASASGCSRVILRLLPDQFFPMHGNEKPYIHKQIPLEGEKPAMFRTKTKCYIELTEHWARLPEIEKMGVRQQAREHGIASGCDSWEVWFGSNHKLDSGSNTRKGNYGVGRG